MSELGWSGYLLIIAAGIFTGIINTLAGSGSLITLPIFTFLCGLPPAMANATNRVGILLQTAVGAGAFHRKGTLELKALGWLVVPAVVGSVPGAWIALSLNDKAMNMALALLMILMLGVILLRPERWLQPGEVDFARRKKPLGILIFFLIGMYAGFIQAGVGVFLMAALVLSARYSMVQANGIKLLLVGLFNVLPLLMFWGQGLVRWDYGLLMAVCQAAGAWIATHFIHKTSRANEWLRYALIVVVLVSAAKYLAEALSYVA